MSCLITSGLALDCIDSLGGIKAAYVSVNAVFTTVTYATDNLITGATGTGTFFEYELPKDTASYTETFNVSETNGTFFAAQALTMNLQKLSSDKRNELLLLARNRDIKVLFEDNNGSFWLMGLTRGGTVTAGTAVTGTAPGDANQYSLTITANEPNLAFEVEGLAALHGFTITNA